jgi:hypothetical protein
MGNKQKNWVPHRVDKSDEDALRHQRFNADQIALPRARRDDAKISDGSSAEISTPYAVIGAFQL